MNAEIPLLRRVAAEFVGTPFLVLVGPGASAIDTAYHGTITHVRVSLAFAIIIAAMIVAFGAISGAHINPAVTVALSSVRQFPRRDVAAYLVAQCAGAIVGALAIVPVARDGIAAAATVPLVSPAAALGAEAVMSALLIMVILRVMALPDPGASGVIAIGLTVGVCALVGGPLTGASMNPARSLGPAVISGQWQHHWIYWIAPIGGMIVAAHGVAWLSGAPRTGS
ncbi:MAG: MIP/aquaporin family protein [Gemmatimonadales bacterium]